MTGTQGSDNSLRFMLFLELYKYVEHSILHNLEFLFLISQISMLG